jgi:osmotically-inducible protein OsmY
MTLKALICALLALTFFGLAVAADKNITDDSIYDNVRRKLASDPIVKGGALQVDVKQGTVTLTGTVDEQKQKDRATKLAKKVSGVKSVTNELKVVQREVKK